MKNLILLMIMAIVTLTAEPTLVFETTKASAEIPVWYLPHEEPMFAFSNTDDSTITIVTDNGVVVAEIPYVKCHAVSRHFVDDDDNFEYHTKSSSITYKATILDDDAKTELWSEYDFYFLSVNPIITAQGTYIKVMSRANSDQLYKIKLYRFRDDITLESMVKSGDAGYRRHLSLSSSNSNFHIEALSGNNPTISVYDLHGRLLQETPVQNVQGGSASVPIPALPHGVYVADVKEGGARQSIKFQQ